MRLPEILNHGWTNAVINHLWQSTVVALLAWLFTLALRNNSARIRYSIWLFASVKFLVPFGLLVSFGSHWPGARIASSYHADPALYSVVEEFSLPFHQSAAPTPTTLVSSPHASSVVWPLLASVWLCGSIFLLAKWISDWRCAARLAARATPANNGRELKALRRAERKAEVLTQIPLRLSASQTEPGVFGAIRPVLLWPHGLSDRLDDSQIEAIMAHEIEHVRRHDNLTATIHACVETLFWFHPLVRWIRARMNEERERACDEKVIGHSTRPEAYAESILKVCAFCTEPPSPCVSSVSGADLKQRILRIMTSSSCMPLSSVSKFALSATALLVLAAPLGLGMMHGQATASTDESTRSSASSPLPKYEVASIKPATEANNIMIRIAPDGFSFQGVEVQRLLQDAFGVERDRIIGAPKWVQSNRYDVQAKVAPEDAPKMRKLKMEQRREMLLPVLEERLHLKYHHETRELPMYTLIVAKGGPKLTESKAGEPMPILDGRTELPPPGGEMAPPGSRGPIAKPDRPPIIGEGMRMGPGSIQSHGGNMEFLSHSLSGILGRTVVDKTGLTGNYDFTLNWTPDETMRDVFGGPQGGPPPDTGGPTLFSALEEQVGLKLESQKVTVDVIVIDHIEPPSEN